MRNVFALRRIALGLSLMVAVAPTGCGPSGSEEELGTVVYELPQVPGADKPYPLPAMDPEAKSPQTDATGRTPEMSTFPPREG